MRNTHGINSRRHSVLALLLTATAWSAIGMPALAQVAVDDPAMPAAAASTTNPSGELNTDEPVPQPDLVQEPLVERGALSEAAATAVDPNEPEAGQTLDTTTTPVSDIPQRESSSASAYGLWVIMPALVAIVLAIFFRQVVPALVVGVLVGAYMILPYSTEAVGTADAPSIIRGFRLAAETYIMGAVFDPDAGYGHLKIMFFTLVIGFVVGVIGRNGGTAGMVELVAGETRSARRAGLTAWLAGLVVFFDDYANTMIVGPTMRSVFDRVKLSRAKLAYIVDSTAAPVASLALIGTWVGAEIGFIKDGLDKIDMEGAPAFLIGEDGNLVSAMNAFIFSLPYRFYPILALVMVFLIVVTRRDFGPMLRAEAKELSRLDPDPRDKPDDAKDDDAPRPCWWLGCLPILSLVGVTVGILVAGGWQADTVAAMRVTDAWGTMPMWQKASIVFGNSDSYAAIFYGALLTAIFAVVLTMLARACRMRDAIDAGMEGMSRMFPAIVILILAWALSAVSMHLQLDDVVAAKLKAMNFPAVWTPLAVFLSAALISFATGSSWGTMTILCPITVTIAARLIGADPGMTPVESLNLFYASVGSVLAGAVFGDHCSPISDTTVLSSLAADCPHETHVWTQLPYALTTAVVAMAVGDVACNIFHQPWYIGHGAGVVILVLILLIVGRRAVPDPELAEV